MANCPATIKAIGNPLKVLGILPAAYAARRQLIRYPVQKKTATSTKGQHKSFKDVVIIIGQNKRHSNNYTLAITRTR